MGGSWDGAGEVERQLRRAGGAGHHSTTCGAPFGGTSSSNSAARIPGDSLSSSMQQIKSGTVASTRGRLPPPPPSPLPPLPLPDSAVPDAGWCTVAHRPSTPPCCSSSASSATKFSFWKWICRRCFLVPPLVLPLLPALPLAPLPLLVPSSSSWPRAKPAAVLRCTSTTLPAERAMTTLHCNSGTAVRHELLHGGCQGCHVPSQAQAHALHASAGAQHGLHPPRNSTRPLPAAATAAAASRFACCACATARPSRQARLRERGTATRFSCSPAAWRTVDRRRCLQAASAYRFEPEPARARGLIAMLRPTQCTY